MNHDNDMRPLIVVLIAVLSGCANTQYTSGRIDISQIPDMQLATEIARMNNFQTTIWANESSAAELAAMQAEMRRRHPSWNWENIVTRTLVIDMTPNEVIMVRGRPIDLNASTSRFGTHDQWVYLSGGEYVYVYFRNDKVDGWTGPAKLW